MVKQIGPTGAESFWDDDITDDADCETYLQNAREKTDAEVDEEDDDSAEEESDETDEEEEEETAEDDAEVVSAEEGEEDNDEEDKPADETAKTMRRKTAKPIGEKMAKTKASGAKTKAESIREVIESRRKAGDELRPRDIIAALEKKGVEVNASQVSITLRAMGVPPIKRGKEKTKRVHAEANGAERSREALKRTPSRHAPDAPAAMGDTEQLLNAAGKLMRTAGSFESALAALRLYNNVVSQN